MAESKMPKPIYLIAAGALAAAAIFVGAQRASDPGRSSVEAAAATTPTMSPLDMMSTDDRSLPVEAWDAP